MHYCLAIEYWIQVEELCRGKTRKDCLIVKMQLHKIININNIINIIIFYCILNKIYGKY